MLTMCPSMQQYPQIHACVLAAVALDSAGAANTMLAVASKVIVNKRMDFMLDEAVCLGRQRVSRETSRVTTQ